MKNTFGVRTSQWAKSNTMKNTYIFKPSQKKVHKCTNPLEGLNFIETL